MTPDIINELIDGRHSLVIRNAKTCVYDGHGIADLYRLLHSEPEKLRNSTVADKVVGKAAMALMMVGGVSEVYAAVISDLALRLSAQSAVAVSYGRRVDHITRHDGVGWCPMEELCRECATASECLYKIEEMMQTKTIGK